MVEVSYTNVLTDLLIGVEIPSEGFTVNISFDC